ncbi:MAG: hypothetical protein ACK5YR_13830, partial [Pirellula sp.]
MEPLPIPTPIDEPFTPPPFRMFPPKPVPFSTRTARKPYPNPPLVTIPWVESPIKPLGSPHEELSALPYLLSQAWVESLS